MMNAVPHYSNVSIGSLEAWREPIYLEPSDQSSVINDYRNAIDNDLHQELNLKYPKKENTEEKRNTAT
jgi:hypothetical protein